MAVLDLVMGPDPIFRKKAEPVGSVTDEVRRIMDDMLETLHFEHGIGMAANMVGILKRVIVVEVDENGEKKKFLMADPEIIEKSEEKQIFMEASLCFPGISADVERPKTVKIKYLDYEGELKELEASGFLSTCFQHEIDYLDGKIFLDYLSPLKRNTLMRKMNKVIKKHVHGNACAEGCEH